jgi:hypothetical protein
LSDSKTQQTTDKCWVSTIVSTQPTHSHYIYFSFLTLSEVKKMSSGFQKKIILAIKFVVSTMAGLLDPTFGFLVCSCLFAWEFLE